MIIYLELRKPLPFAIPSVDEFKFARYRWALPSIQMGNENLKFGYAMAQVLLNTPSMASWGHAPF